MVKKQKTEIKEETFDIIVKPNSSKSEVIGFDDGLKAYKVNIKAAPEGGKANLEVVKFFSKIIGKRVRIINGLTSKKKTVTVK